MAKRALPFLVVLAWAFPVTAGSAPGPGYFASDNVSYVGHVPLNYDSSGARIVGSRLYLTTSRDLRIYDISSPEQPVFRGNVLLLQEPQFAEEDLDTNGRIALVEAFGTLNVIDVREPTAPAIVGQLDVPDFHTVSCVLDCSYAYASSGQIVDLRDPANPVLARDPADPTKEARWGKGKPAGSAHDVTEVSPGLIVTSSIPIMLLDARADPVAPTLLATGVKPDNRFIHGNLWPRGGSDRFLLVGGETTGPRCDTATAGAFMTWDTSGWATAKRFTMIDQYRVTSGLPTEGRTLAAQLCAHWFQPHPAFSDGGLVAMAWYDYGVRLLRVSSEGTISEAGYFIAAGSVASAVYWADEHIAYVVDYNRGLDIIRVAV